MLDVMDFLSQWKNARTDVDFRENWSKDLERYVAPVKEEITVEEQPQATILTPNE